MGDLGHELYFGDARYYTPSSAIVDGNWDLYSGTDFSQKSCHRASPPGFTSSARPTSPAWWAVDLQTNYLISRIKILNMQGTCNWAGCGGFYYKSMNPVSVYVTASGASTHVGGLLCASGIRFNSNNPGDRLREVACNAPVTGGKVWVVQSIPLDDDWTVGRGNSDWFAYGAISFCEFGIYASLATPAPTKAPTRLPTLSPTKTPTRNPTRAPTRMPTPEPTPSPTSVPTTKPTYSPTRRPTTKPTATPTVAPTRGPTSKPTAAPTVAPTQGPTSKPTALPTLVPTGKPSSTPTQLPTAAPTQGPTSRPSATPTGRPTPLPTPMPTPLPTLVPTKAPTVAPTGSLCNGKPDEQGCADYQFSPICAWDGIFGAHLRITCPVVCDSCATTTITTTSTATSTTTVTHKTCNGVLDPSDCQAGAQFCMQSGILGEFARKHCPATCGACESTTTTPSSSCTAKYDWTNEKCDRKCNKPGPCTRGCMLKCSSCTCSPWRLLSVAEPKFI